MMATNLILNQYGHLTDAIRQIKTNDLTDNGLATLAEIVILKKQIQRFNFVGRYSSNVRSQPLLSGGENGSFQIVNNLYKSVLGQFMFRKSFWRRIPGSLGS